MVGNQGQRENLERSQRGYGGKHLSCRGTKMKITLGFLIRKQEESGVRHPSVERK